MAIKHGAIADPTGITLTGCLVHELRTREEDFAHEAFDSDGTFEDGKSIRTRTTKSMSGEALSTLSLPTVGSGAATSASPHIDSAEEVQKNEGASDFSVEAHHYSSGQGDYS